MFCRTHTGAICGKDALVSIKFAIVLMKPCQFGLGKSLSSNYLIVFCLKTILEILINIYAFFLLVNFNCSVICSHIGQIYGRDSDINIYTTFCFVLNINTVRHTTFNLLYKNFQMTSF